MIVVALWFSGWKLVAAPQDDAAHVLARGVTWERFLASATAQRDQWLKTTSSVSLPADLVDRFRRASSGLQMLAVAEDWCPDSVNALPHVAALAASASIAFRIINRDVGAAVMNRHRTRDGRVATPTIVLLRENQEVAAWVERPAVVQDWFLSMATNPESAKRFGDRQRWYDADRGRTVLTEITVLAEQTMAPARP